jgi:glycosidase
MNKKITIYQVLPRLFGNRNTTRKENGTIEENGCGKFHNFDEPTLKRIQAMGFTHIWYTGVIRHATTTDYSRYGIPRQHPEIVKGKAGSAYAITDYYDVDPDLAINVKQRMQEWEQLIERTHRIGMKVVMDFVPNHVAREYHSICKPTGTHDLGELDNKEMLFSTENNFYYCKEHLDLGNIQHEGNIINDLGPYVEYPARATGNDQFSSKPQTNDWYETIKLNYGVDYCNANGRSYHFTPIPNTWKKMTDILLFWAEKGIDAFRCDMAEMVPSAFWKYATNIIKEHYPQIIFIGEVYDPNQYRTYISAGFDYLYDKVGMYDALKSIIRGEQSASNITYQWQPTDDIKEHMLYFLENHDEQRIASEYFAGNAQKAIPAVMFSALFRNNPFMLYSGQEFGERGMDKEGFSGIDGRTTIFDYWAPDTLSRAYSDRQLLTPAERQLAIQYHNILNIAIREKAIDGDSFDLMYVNNNNPDFDTYHQYAFMRKKDDDVLFVVVNFSDYPVNIKVNIPEHAFDFLEIPEKKISVTDLITGDSAIVELEKDKQWPISIDANNGRIYKFNISMDDKAFLLNEHHKDEFPPAHTAEHLLNQLMVRMFGCERSKNAHIERKKSKISYILDHKPTRQEEKTIEREMNRLIDEDMEVSYDFVNRDNIPEGISLDRLPDDASEMLRIVRIGNYDICPCIGKHVRSTGQIGRFEMLGTNWDEQAHSFRIRFKVIP